MSNVIGRRGKKLRIWVFFIYKELKCRHWKKYEEHPNACNMECKRFIHGLLGNGEYFELPQCPVYGCSSSPGSGIPNNIYREIQISCDCEQGIGEGWRRLPRSGALWDQLNLEMERLKVIKSELDHRRLEDQKEKAK